MKETDEIIRELTNEELKKRKPFAHFGWEGGDSFAFSIFSDGYWESAKLLLEKMKSESNNYSLVDSLIYPLFFNYRHSVEMYLKQLFFNLGEHKEDARSKYLKLGHNLIKLWDDLKPILENGKEHVGSSIDILAVEHYIKSINEFDPNSMVMRYPIGKNLNTNKDKEYHFDFINFGERMNDLCNSLRQLDYDLSNQMTEESTQDECDKYLIMIDKYRSKIDLFIEVLKSESAIESQKFNSFNFLTTLQNNRDSKLNAFYGECEPDLLILLDNLFYAGRTVKSNEIRLSISPNGRLKEFIKLCNNILDNDGLCFGTQPSDEQINILCKASSALLENISEALFIIDFNRKQSKTF